MPVLPPPNRNDWLNTARSEVIAMALGGTATLAIGGHRWNCLTTIAVANNLTIVRDSISNPGTLFIAFFKGGNGGDNSKRLYTGRHLNEAAAWLLEYEATHTRG